MQQRSSFDECDDEREIGGPGGFIELSSLGPQYDMLQSCKLEEPNPSVRSSLSRVVACIHGFVGASLIDGFGFLRSIDVHALIYDDA